MPAPGNTPYSDLAEIPLPSGTVRSEIFTQSPTMESWGFPGGDEFAVQYLREHLPIGEDHLGLKWCSEDGDDEYTEWVWGDTPDLLMVHVLGDLVTITRESPDPSGIGCI